MTDKAGKLYRVLLGDIDVRNEKGEFVRQKKGAEIALSAAAAEHLLSVGYVEEVGKKPKEDA
jgi:hypothetical protein